MHKALLGPAGAHPQVLRELAGGLGRPLQKGDVPQDWKKANGTEALTDAEPVLSADEELVIAKLQRGTTVRPQLRLALDQLWVVSGGKEAAGQEEEEEEEGSGEDRTAIILIWPTGSCIATFGSRARKELWVGTLLGTPEGAKRARVSRLPSLKLLQKELSRRHAWRTFSARSLERLMEGQAEADPKQGPATVPSDNRGGLCRSPAGGSSGRRRRGLPWPFALRRTPAAAQAPGQAGSGCSRALFGQPLAALCGEDGTLPQPIQELLAVLQQEGPSTEGIFRRAASGAALRELREALDRGADVDLGSQPALLLAVILKDFLRSIPSKLLVNDLYEDWMAAMQKTSKEEKISELKAVAEKLPAANLLLLKRLLSLLQHIGHNASASRMSCSNLAICVGPNLLSPANEDLLPLEAMLEVAEKVKALVEFLVENCRDVVGEETTDLSCPPAEESPAPTERSSDLCLEEPSVPAVTADSEREAEALPHAPPSLLGVLKEAGGDTVVESEAGEVLLRQSFMGSILGGGGGTVRNVADASQPKGSPLES
ncbi:T-cell activation Rho GTPase-activating protein-like [Spheniscus humboldti]